MQLHLPIQPPLALLANRLAEGMLGLRWAKIKVGSGSNAVMKTVQVSDISSSLVSKAQPAVLCTLLSKIAALLPLHAPSLNPVTGAALVSALANLPITTAATICTRLPSICIQILLALETQAGNVTQACSCYTQTGRPLHVAPLFLVSPLYHHCPVQSLTACVLQVMLSNCDAASLSSLGKAINVTLGRASSRPLQPLSSNVRQVMCNPL